MGENDTTEDQPAGESTYSRLRLIWNRYKSVPIVVGLVAAIALGFTQTVTSGVSGLVSKIWTKVDPPPVVSASISAYVGQCSPFIIPEQSLAELGRSPEKTDAAFGKWGRENGYESSPQSVLVTITGYDTRPVTLTALRFIVTKRDEAFANGYIVGGGCGGEASARYAQVDLDQNPPRVVDSSADVVPLGTGLTVTPLRFPYIVSGSETESLLILADTKAAVSWRAEINWNNGVEAGVIYIDQKGEPFETMSGDKTTRRLFPDGAGGWSG